MRYSQVSRLRRFVFLSLVLSSVVGCSFSRAKWRPPQTTRVSSAPQPEIDASTLASAEAAYADGVELERCGIDSCVDRFYETAAIAWCHLSHAHYSIDSQPGYRHSGYRCSSRADELYHSALTKLITAGQRYGRFRADQGLTVWTAGRWQTIPTQYHAFVRPPEDFNHLVPVGSYTTKELENIYSCRGLGVATVAVHCRRPDERFRQRQQVFAATVVMRPQSERAAGPFVLDLYDPVRIGETNVNGVRTPIRRDLSAPLAYRLKDERSQYLTDFLQPGQNSSEQGLFMVEPYQPGKIPVVFVHGLLSDKFTWANLANEIQARPDLQSRYQIWGFEYSTGQPFLLSAATLRRQLKELQCHLDPGGHDAALTRMVLVGHSMGGLVAKLQVAHSGDQLWRAVANRPLENVAMMPTTRSKLAEAFYFSPGPSISRVVFIGTPHWGSVWAQRPIGRIGAALVSEPSSMQAEHAQLIQDNPYVFSREFSRRVPTSVDLLRPESPLLQATNTLAVSPSVKLHSIIGRGRRMWCSGDSDGVVPVSSARIRGVESEKFVFAKHSDIHKSREGMDELFRILRWHLKVSHGFQWRARH